MLRSAKSMTSVERYTPLEYTYSYTFTGNYIDVTVYI
jgi:hypothetical protein